MISEYVLAAAIVETIASEPGPGVLAAPSGLAVGRNGAVLAGNVGTGQDSLVEASVGCNQLVAGRDVARSNELSHEALVAAEGVAVETAA
jgi:hypothetical protein